MERGLQATHLVQVVYLERVAFAQVSPQDTPQPQPAAFTVRATHDAAAVPVNGGPYRPRGSSHRTHAVHGKVSHCDAAPTLDSYDAQLDKFVSRSSC
jgi:hypothetical protein